jgi:hypothetical protein
MHASTSSLAIVDVDLIVICRVQQRTVWAGEFWNNHSNTGAGWAHWLRLYLFAASDDRL